ncbi:MAG: TonB-dependent receptor domain-containing protein, partial [Acidobacteriota bacterium]
GNTSSEYSRGGAQVSAVTRAGTNDVHGSVFWFHRNDVFNANTFFNNSAGVGVPKLIRNQFGGRIGGPIVEDKAFFFFSYQQTRESKGIPVNRVVWTQTARQGIFGYLDDLRTTPEAVAANPGLIRFVDLLGCSGNLFGVNTQAILGRDCVDERFNLGSPIVDPATGRVTLDPFVSGTVFAAIPLPNNFDLGDGLNTGGFRFNSSSLTFEHLPKFRFDYIFNQKHSFTGTAHYIDREIQGDFVNGREPRYPSLGPLGNRVTHSKSFSAALTSTLTPTVVNEFRAGFLIHGENQFQVNQPFDTPFTLDFSDITDPYDPSNNLEARDNDTWHFRDTASWVKGSHTLKFGGEFRHRWVHTRGLDEVNPFGEIDFDDSDAPPDFSEGDLRDVSVDANGVPTPGTDIESVDRNNGEEMLNGLIGALAEVEVRYNVTSLDDAQFSLVTERRIYRNREFDWFVNDTWQVTPRLTLNLGVRWEFATVPIETQRLSLLPEGGEDAVFGISGPDGFFNPGVFTGQSCAELNALPMARTEANVRNFITACSTKMVPGGSNNGEKFFDNDYNNFAPVIGLAWDPWGDGKTSVRAGYRISYMQDHFNIIDGNVDDNEGLRVDQDCVPPDGTCGNNPLLLRDMATIGSPIAAPPPFVLPATRTFLDSTFQDFRTYADGLATPYYQEWNLSLSREILPNTALEVRYVGNRGVKLRRVADFNEINIFAFDPVSGTTFLESFRLAQANLACNQLVDGADDFSDRGNFADPACVALGAGANPLMDALIAGDPRRLDSDGGMVDALEFNEPGDFIDELVFDTSSRPMSGESRVRGGSFWGAVLEGRFPANFFQANPFVASARRMTNDGFSTYHALEIEVRRRLSRGLMLQANYTFQKGLADFDGDQNTLINDTRPSSVINARSTIQQFMPRQQVKINWIYELPFGPGKAFAPASPFWGKVLGGWQTGGIVNFRTGRPLTITSGRGTFHRQAVSDANTVNLSQPMSNSDLRDLTGITNIGGGVFWLDPCMSAITGGSCTDPNAIQGLFGLPNPGELGQLSQTPIYGPQRFDMDFSLMKKTQITETTDVEFRWEVFNITNNTNFNIPVTNIFSTSFGQITRTVGNPRLMQFAVKINF